MRKTWYAIALFIIWILMMLPVVAAQQILTVQKFSGVDEVRGYAKENDILTIQILAEMLGNPTEPVAKQRARIYHEESYEFMDSCSQQAQAIQECTYQTEDLIYGGEDEYEVRLYDESNNEIARETLGLTVDFLGPQILTMSVSPEASTAPVPTTITYNVEDYGTSTGEKTHCSGIGLVNFTANGETVGIVSTAVGVCSKQGTVTFTPDVSGPSETVTVCGVAYDHLGHKSLPTCKTVLIDSQKPTPTELVLRDNDGFEISHARTNQIIVADVSVRIPDIDVDPTQVFADLSSLNPNLGRIARHDQSGSWFIWRDITISSPDTCEVTVDATDRLGNSDTKTLTCTISIDDDGPTPTSIYTQFVDEDGTSLLGANGTIHVDFTESGSGMDKSEAYLDLRELGKGREVKADSCEKTGTESWKCSWNIIPTVASGDYTVSVQPVSRDDLDNQVTTTIDQQIRFDKTAPGELTLVEIAAFRGNERVLTDSTILGETIEFVVSGTGFTDATADFSDLGGGSEVPFDICDYDNLTTTCIFGVTTAVSGPQSTNVTFTFRDVAGNTATLSTSEVSILGILNETNPNYWTISTKCSPSLLDRRTLSTYDHPVYCMIDMDTTNSQASPISVSGPVNPITDCEGDMQYISSLEMQNNFAGSTEPYLALSLIPTDYEIDTLEITCPVSTFTRIGDFVPVNPETDNVTVKLEFYNLPLGEIYENINDELGDVADHVDGIWDWIGKLQKFMGYAEKICEFLNIFMNIIAILSALAAWLSIIQAIVKLIPVVGPGIAEAINSVESSLCNVSETGREAYNTNILGTFKKFCDVITCQAGLFDVLGWVSDDWEEKDVANAEAGISDWYYNWISGGSAGAEGELRGSVAGQGQNIQDPNVYLNVRDSLVYSIVIPPFCIPGIIYNLDKWRQIECRYGMCLLQDFREQGLPLSACKDQRAYMQCRFVVGEIFNLVPFAPIVDYYTNMIQQMISDPAVLVAVGIGVVAQCKSFCTPDAPNVGWRYYACAGVEILSQLGNAIKTYESIKTVGDFGEMGNQWCEEFEDEYDDYKSEIERA